jgi:hypothetical protein
MAWVGLVDSEHADFSAFGIGSDRRIEPVTGLGEDDELACGSIVIETRLSAERRPQPLLMFRRPGDWGLNLSLQAIPGGGVTLVVAQGADVRHFTVNQSETGRTDVLRITYAWDSPAGRGFMAVERTDHGHVSMSPLHAPRPVKLRDLREMFGGASGDLYLSPDLVYAALCTHVETIGPAPTLALGTPVLTPDGYRRAGDLQRGDVVVTASGGTAPVLYRVDRTVPARGSFSPIRVRAPYFGLLGDITVAPAQRLLISGSEVEYLFGHEAVYVPACHLAGASAAVHVDIGRTMRLTQVLLPNHEAIVAAGTAAESLYIGRLRRKKTLLPASLLAGVDRSTLPDHGRPDYPVLRAFDALILAEHRAA